MKRIFIFAAITLIFLSFLAFLGYKAYRIQGIKRHTASLIQHLPSLPFYFPGGFPPVTGNPVIINYFSPDCEHCQYMARQLAGHRNELAGSRLCMITPENRKSAESFMKDYGLDTLNFVHLGLDTSFRFFRTFGTASIPSFYIYNKQEGLVRRFDGETKIENIIQAIHE